MFPEDPREDPSHPEYRPRRDEIARAMFHSMLGAALGLFIIAFVLCITYVADPLTNTTYTVGVSEETLHFVTMLCLGSAITLTCFSIITGWIVWNTRRP